MDREAQPIELALLALVLVAEALAALVALVMAITQAKAQPLAAHGEIGNGRKDESRPSDRSSTSYGETQSYLLRRLARDQPQLLDQIGPMAQLQEAAPVWTAPMAQLQEAVKGKPGRPPKQEGETAPRCGALQGDPTLAADRHPTDRKSRLIRTLTNLASVTV